MIVRTTSSRHINVVLVVPADSKSSFDTTYDFVAGEPVPLRMEYRKPDGNGNVELQWSLIGNAAESLAGAVAAAQESDLTVLAVGGSDQTTNEGCDRAELSLPGRQLELVQKVHAVAKKLVVVLIGEPCNCTWAQLLTLYGCARCDSRDLFRWTPHC